MREGWIRQRQKNGPSTFIQQCLALDFWFVSQRNLQWLKPMGASFHYLKPKHCFPPPKKIPLPKSAWEETVPYEHYKCLAGQGARGL